MSQVDPGDERIVRIYLERQVLPPTLALGEVVLLTWNGEHFAPRYYQGFDPATGEPFFSARPDGGGPVFKLTTSAPDLGVESGYAARTAASLGV